MICLKLIYPGFQGSSLYDFPDLTVWEKSLDPHKVLVLWEETVEKCGCHGSTATLCKYGYKYKDMKMREKCGPYRLSVLWKCCCYGKHTFFHYVGKEYILVSLLFCASLQYIWNHHHLHLYQLVINYLFNWCSSSKIFEMLPRPKQ